MASRGGVDPTPDASTRITLRTHECVREAGFHHFDVVLTSPCYLLLWEESGGRRLVAKDNQEWENGVGTLGPGTFNNGESTQSSSVHSCETRIG